MIVIPTTLEYTFASSSSGNLLQAPAASSVVGRRNHWPATNINSKTFTAQDHLKQLSIRLAQYYLIKAGGYYSNQASIKIDAALHRLLKHATQASITVQLLFGHSRYYQLIIIWLSLYDYHYTVIIISIILFIIMMMHGQLEVYFQAASNTRSASKMVQFVRLILNHLGYRPGVGWILLENKLPVAHGWCYFYYLLLLYYYYYIIFIALLPRQNQFN